MPGSVVVGGSPQTVQELSSPLLTSVRKVARSDPARVALAGDHGQIGYGELWRRAEEVARSLGLRPGVVGVPAVHDPIAVISLLGVWIAAGTYCPVDPSFPEEHVEALLAAVGGRRLAELAPRTGTGDDLVDGRVAYVLFTSGSTGRPKPVAVSHRALAIVVPALQELFGLARGDRVLQFASLSWDTAFEEILPTLAAGARVVFGRDAHTGALTRLVRLVEREEVSVLNLPTALWHELVWHLSETSAGLPASVRLVVIGGEAVNPARLEAWRRLPGADRIRLLNTYGATETALITHAVDLHGPVVALESPGGLFGTTPYGPPVGRPLAHVRQRLTDAGELLVGGPNLAEGYPGLPEATRERFIELEGTTYFRTGDLARQGREGLVHHLGRLDAQVKVRGIRVDPGEVEANLLRCPGVAAASAIGVTVAGRTALAAYVVASGGRPPGEPGHLTAAIRGFLGRHAPGHLHPARITVVPGLVFTASGKVDRRATHERYGVSS